MLTEYRKFLDKPNELILAAEPRQPLDLKTVKLYKASDVPALLNLTLQAK